MNKQKATYRTIEDIGNASLVVRKSKFLSFAMPARSEGQINEQLRSLKSHHPRARHICYAWRLNPLRPKLRAYDAGEPSGTAGKPILNEILAMDLFNVAVYVVRYFGGIKLGTAGLRQAYRSAAYLALDDATIITTTLCHHYALHFDYAHMPQVMELLKSSGAEIESQEFADTPTLQFKIPIDVAPQMIPKLHQIVCPDQPLSTDNDVPASSCIQHLFTA